ncbi:MAG: hypothetical protein HZA17_04465 [Nitrospirae bacterium]|nr:hypothetical protein [Nitrospirota bacterium]
MKKRILAVLVLITISMLVGGAEGATINVIAGKGGTISPAAAITVKPGAIQQFTVTPATGYYISGVTGCGGKLSGNIYTTGQVSADCSVSASFAPVITVSPTITPTLTPTVAYTVTATAGAGGTISPSGNVFVNSGTTKQFAVTPGADYDILSVTGCNGTLSGSTYTTGAITAGCTVTASFKRRTPQISWFKVNNDSSDTNAQTVILNFNTAAGSMPTHYRASERTDFLGAAWIVLIGAPTYNLSSGDGSKTVYLQLKDSSTDGISTVVSDAVNLRTRQLYTLSGRDFFATAQNYGFNSRADKLSTLSDCGIYASDNPNDNPREVKASISAATFGSRCNFTFFEGQTLKNGFIYKSFTGGKHATSSECDVSLTSQPTPGATSVKFTFHGWVEPPIKNCWYSIDTITLEGPVDTDWAKAFMY